MQRDPREFEIAPGGAVGRAFNGGIVAGGADERLPVAISRDQGERLRRAELLDAPTSHDWSFPVEMPRALHRST
jgi:hypothetical protein